MNPGGVRLGTAEIYSVVEKFKNVKESIVVSQSWDNDVRIILFLVLNRGYLLDDLLIKKLKKTIRSEASPRHVPTKILEQAMLDPQSDGHTRSLVELLRRERLTVGQFLERQPLRGPHRVLVGVPEMVADWLEVWFLERAADGFNIGNLTHETLAIFVEEVVPRLQDRGLFRREYEGKTLRENFCGEVG